MYQTQAGEERMKAIDKELGYDECTKIYDSWYHQTEVSEAELSRSTAMHKLESILDTTQPMEVDTPQGLPALEDNPEPFITSLIPECQIY